MKPGEHWKDRPEFVARVFRLKLRKLREDLKKNGLFGRAVADTHVVEYQKRGLPQLLQQKKN